MNNIQKVIEESNKEFDEKFGKDGPERDSDSIGKSAGCDDCAGNIEIRRQHKLHLTATISNILSAIEAEVQNRKHVHDPDDEVSNYHWMNVGRNEALSDIKAIIKSAKEQIK